MAFMNAKKRNKTLTIIIVAFVSVGLLASVSTYWLGGSATNLATPNAGISSGSAEDLGVRDYTLGSTLMQEGKTKEASDKFNSAIKNFEQALKTNPKNVQVLGDMATSYFYTGNADKAIETANKALQITPDYTPARMNLAIYLYEGKGNAVEAIKELKKVKSGDPEYQKAQQLITDFGKPPAFNGSSLPPKGNGTTTSK